MKKASTPSFLAIHPAWAGEMAQLDNPEAVQKYVDTLQLAYMGPAAALAASGFDPDMVYQISENEFYSYGDGLRYTKAPNGTRIALVDMKGLLFGGSDYNRYESIAAQIHAAENPAYAGVLIRADSPGGTVKGMRKLNAAVAGYSKPIGVHVSGLLASAAAYSTAAADFIYADPNEDDTFGSIGVFTIKENHAKRLEKEGIEVAVIRSESATDKFKPNPYEPWEDGALAKIQEEMNREEKSFHTAMISQRGLSASQMDEVKKGGEYHTEEAYELGLHDGTATMEEAIERISTFKSIYI
jgi:ClpP class serine protease